MDVAKGAEAKPIATGWVYVTVDFDVRKGRRDFEGFSHLEVQFEICD